MKAERRQEPQDNSLVRGARNLPDFWRQYGYRIALGALLVALAVVLVMRWRAGRDDERRERAERLTAARGELDALRKGPVSVSTPPPITVEDFQQIQAQVQNFPPEFQERMFQQMLQRRMQPRVMPVPTVQRIAMQQEVWTAVDAAVGDVLTNSSDPAQQAEAKLLRADANLYWAVLASLGDPPQATTRPEFGMTGKKAEYLDKAASNYADVAKEASLSPQQAGSAKLGLAAVAEAREQWDEAGKVYAALIAESPDALIKQVADARQKQLARIKTPPLLGEPQDPVVPPPPFDPSSKPTTGPSTATSTRATTMQTTVPTTVPAMPATMPAAPATQPAAVPATGPSTLPSVVLPTTMPAAVPMTAPTLPSTRP